MEYEGALLALATGDLVGLHNNHQHYHFHLPHPLIRVPPQRHHHHQTSRLGPAWYQTQKSRLRKQGKATIIIGTALTKTIAMTVTMSFILNINNLLTLRALWSTRCCTGLAFPTNINVPTETHIWTWTGLICLLKRWLWWWLY